MFQWTVDSIISFCSKYFEHWKKKMCNSQNKNALFLYSKKAGRNCDIRIKIGCEQRCTRQSAHNMCTDVTTPEYMILCTLCKRTTSTADSMCSNWWHISLKQRGHFVGHSIIFGAAVWLHRCRNANKMLSFFPHVFVSSGKAMSINLTKKNIRVIRLSMESKHAQIHHTHTDTQKTEHLHVDLHNRFVCLNRNFVHLNRTLSMFSVVLTIK